MSNPDLIEKQAACFLVDAEEYRSIHHRIDEDGLKIYKFLYSKLWSITLFISIVVLHSLAFVEHPSSLSRSSHIHGNSKNSTAGIFVHPTILNVLESVMLLTIFVDTIFQAALFGKKVSLKNPWLMSSLFLIVVSWIDLFVSFYLGIRYNFRLRRFFRPFFALQKSQLMKKVLKSLSKTLKDIFSVCVLLGLWLMAFTIIAMSIFNGFESDTLDENFKSLYTGFWTLLVLLTTANNPDAMIPAFNEDRLAFVFFIIFMSVGIFVFMNVLVAIVFNEFRNHMLDSMQISLVRRRVASRALYEVLKQCQSSLDSTNHNEVEVERLERVIETSSISSWRKVLMIKNLKSLGSMLVDWKHVQFVLEPLDDHKESKMAFEVPKYTNQVIKNFQNFALTQSFEIIGLLICFVNVIVIILDVSNKLPIDDGFAIALNVFNWVFIVIYVIEQIFKFFAMGWRTYFSKQGCIFDFFITLFILVIKITEVLWLLKSKKTDFFIGKISVWDLSRMTNLLIIVRAARIVLFFPSLTPIINTLFDIPWRMKPLIGIMCLIFYIYALIGMNIFGGKINPAFMRNKTTECGSYQQLNYGGINFNDFYSSLVVLFCLLIVNNWHVFMVTLQDLVSSRWAHLYVISWWIFTVIVVLNCVTAFVIEAYVQRKSFYEQQKVKRFRPPSIIDIDKSMRVLKTNVIANNSFTFQMLFKNELMEPTEEELNSSMKHCEFLRQNYPHICETHDL